MNRATLHAAVGLICMLGSSGLLQAVERITNFESTVTVNVDSSLTITEAITVNAEGISIVRGIIREFPITYYDRAGNYYRVPFEIEAITLNGQPVPYTVKTESGKALVRIGDPNVRLAPGQYTFTITYRTNRQLGFFEKHDELYWNVTGTDWRLPIDHVSARIILPEKSNPDDLKLTAYTGPFGARGTAYSVDVAQDGSIQFKTTAPLKVREGLTIVAGFPKGVVQEPSFVQKANWFLRDNLHILIFLLGLIFLLLAFLLIERSNRRRAGNKPIIPLFSPPEGMTAGQMRYFVDHGYGSRVMACDIVQMATEGLLTIAHQTKWITSNQYTLTQTEQRGNVFQTGFLAKLFGKNKEVALAPKYHQQLDAAQRYLRKAYKHNTDQWFELNYGSFALCALIATLCGITSIHSAPQHGWAFIPIVGYSLLLIVGFRYLKSYTKQGFEIKRTIDGFKLFLATTEQERMKLIGTPPTKTPELYETYLPYAMALGVEQQWTQQFDAIFKGLEQKGVAYSPSWYYGMMPFRPRAFSSGISSGLSQAVSTAGTVSRPGSSSGFGSGGGSGRGGGGGGGGGW